MSSMKSPHTAGANWPDRTSGDRFCQKVCGLGRNDGDEYLGKATVRLEYVVNLIPGWSSALLPLVSSELVRVSVLRAWSTPLRDRKRTPSSMVGLTMNAMVELLRNTVGGAVHHCLCEGP